MIPLKGIIFVNVYIPAELDQWKNISFNMGIDTGTYCIIFATLGLYVYKHAKDLPRNLILGGVRCKIRAPVATYMFVITPLHTVICLRHPGTGPVPVAFRDDQKMGTGKSARFPIFSVHYMPISRLQSPNL